MCDVEQLARASRLGNMQGTTRAELITEVYTLEPPTGGDRQRLGNGNCEALKRDDLFCRLGLRVDLDGVGWN